MRWHVTVEWDTRDGDHFSARDHIEAPNEDAACLALERRCDLSEAVAVFTTAISAEGY